MRRKAVLLYKNLFTHVMPSHFEVAIPIYLLTCTCVGITNCIGDVSWVVSTPRSPVPSFGGFAAQTNLSLPGLRAPERPLFTYTPSLSV